MATLEEFLRTGHLGPLIMGISPMDVMTALGEADSVSRKSNPLLLEYGGVHLAFLRNTNARKHELREIVLDFENFSEPLPPLLELTDWKLSDPPTERRFRDFMHTIGYLPIHDGEGATWRELVFPSGVTARFKDEMLISTRLVERENKSSIPAISTDEREPTEEQIAEMFKEADFASQAGAKRAALLIAWAGLEATLRRLANHTGRKGKIGTQPVVLLRELFSEGQLTPAEHRILERSRQLRMSAAHGLTPVAFQPELLSQIETISNKLLARSLVPDPQHSMVRTEH
jgi:hypothetical protein